MSKYVLPNGPQVKPVPQHNRGPAITHGLDDTSAMQPGQNVSRPVPIHGDIAKGSG